MSFRRRTQEPEVIETSNELAALARAEDLCDQAEALHAEAISESERVLSEAKAEAARLLRNALAAIDENVAHAAAARREQEAHRAAAQAARAEAEEFLQRVRAMERWLVAEQVDRVPAGLSENEIIDLRPPARLSYGVLAQLAR